MPMAALLVASLPSRKTAQRCTVTAPLLDNNIAGRESPSAAALARASFSMVTPAEFCTVMAGPRPR